MQTTFRLLLRMKIQLLVLTAALLSAGCAKIGDPQPPEIRIPARATDLAARQISDFVVLSVTKPERNTNGSEATTLKSVEIFRLSADDGSDAEKSISEKQFLERAVKIISIPDSRFPEYLVDKAFVFQDHFSTEKPSMYSRTFWYSVLFVNNKHQSAGLGNRVSIEPVPLPPPPEELSCQGTQNYILLRWKPPSENTDGSKPPRIAGYNIYRTEVAGMLPSAPLNPAPIQAAEFQDTDFHFNATYYYQITTVGSMQKPYPESLPSNTISILTKDVFPPSPPGEFSAIFQGEEVILLWAPSSSEDVAGYRIYRKEKGTSDCQLVNSDLIRSLSFRDHQVVPGKKYEYEILAVDVYGNTSQAVKADAEQP
jgi:hypothetical protein